MRLLNSKKILQAVGFIFGHVQHTKSTRDPFRIARVYCIKKALPLAAQLPVVICDVTPATLESVEACITITSITCPATCN